MKKHLFPESGTFYKANLHMHTTVSDGRMTPEQVKEEYMKRGYSVIAFTDHEVLVPHNELSDENFLAITSYEVGTNEPDHQGGFSYVHTYHLNLYAKDKNKDVSQVFTMSRMWPPHAVKYLNDEIKRIDFKREYSVESINAVIAKANEDGFFVSYNHPNWSLQSYPDYAELKGLWGVECYNTGCVRSGFPDTMQPIDDLLNKGERVFPLATDDAHAGIATLHDCFGGFTMIKAEKLEYDTIINALLKGDFYASSGPLIKELYVEDGILHVITDDVNKIEFITNRRFRYVQTASENNTINHAEFDLNAFIEDNKGATENDPAPYFRITVTDHCGEQAQTRAYFEEDYI